MLVKRNEKHAMRNQFFHKKQQGAALAISLILLVAMTILGVATLNGTRLAEKVSSNAQQKAIVYETAESIINSISTSADFTDRLYASLTSKFDPPPVLQVIDSAEMSEELDQTNLLGTSVDVNVEAEIQFCAEKAQEGSDLSADESADSNIGYHFDVRATSTIDNSRARAEHVLRVEESFPRRGATGDCYTPGT